MLIARQKRVFQISGFHQQCVAVRLELPLLLWHRTSSTKVWAESWSFVCIGVLQSPRGRR